MNKLVSFEIAKLLKEKGFDEPCVNLYYYPERCKRPTITEVVMWLYENHGIWISVSDAGGFGYMIQFMKIDGDSTIEGLYEYDSPTEAYEAAIKYSLELI